MVLKNERLESLTSEDVSYKGKFFGTQLRATFVARIF